MRSRGNAHRAFGAEGTPPFGGTSSGESNLSEFVVTSVIEISVENPAVGKNTGVSMFPSGPYVL
jgi:hypothetical protein